MRLLVIFLLIMFSTALVYNNYNQLKRVNQLEKIYLNNMKETFKVGCIIGCKFNNYFKCRDNCIKESELYEEDILKIFNL